MKGLISRLLPGKESLFELSVSPICLGEAACYNLRTTQGRVQIFGSSGEAQALELDCQGMFARRVLLTC